jgi:hypothetical protein
MKEYEITFESNASVKRPLLNKSAVELLFSSAVNKKSYLVIKDCTLFVFKDNSLSSESKYMIELEDIIQLDHEVHDEYHVIMILNDKGEAEYEFRFHGQESFQDGSTFMKAIHDEIEKRSDKCNKRTDEGDNCDIVEYNICDSCCCCPCLYTFLCCQMCFLSRCCCDPINFLYRIEE